MNVFFHFLLNNYDIILSVFVYFYIAAFVIAIAVWLREQNIGEMIRNILSLILFVVAGLLVVMSLYKVTVGYRLARYNDVVKEFNHRLLPDTSWVKSKADIFFIHEDRIVSIRLDGRDRHTVFQGNGWIEEFSFSPDGKYMAVMASHGLFLIDRRKGSSRAVEQFGNLPAKARAVVTGLAWAPDSRQLVYHVMKWSQVASQDQWTVYTVDTARKARVLTDAMSFSSLVWDSSNRSLYGVVSGAQKDVYHFALPRYEPRFIGRFSFRGAGLPVAAMAAKGMHVYQPRVKRSFGWPAPLGGPLDPTGRVTVDRGWYLVVHSAPGLKKRLFRVPCVPEMIKGLGFLPGSRHPIIKDLQWLPGRRYAVMEHPFFGMLVLDAATGRIGILDSERGGAFGWYVPPRPRTR